MLTFPREPIVEWYLDGWQDITADVRQGTITITRGRKNEDPKVPPSKCAFVLDDGPEHGDGDYNPRNPLGQWFGHLGRNTPVRMAFRGGLDEFTRDVVSGWDTSPSNGAYTDFVSGGSTTAGSVSAGEGRHEITSTGSFRASYLDDVHVKNVELRTDVTIDSVSNVTGGALEPANLLLRGQSVTSYYMLRVSVSTAEVVTVALMVGSSETLAGPFTVPDLTYGGGTLRVAFQADANTFRGKVWKATDPEPLGWHLAYSHGDVFGAGWLGVRSGVASGNTNTKPVVFRYDNLEIRLPRFAGETAKLLPLSEVDHSNQRTQVECAGILRRLSQGKAPLKSAARRFLTTSPLVTLADYWPLEEQPDETAKGVNVAGGIPMQINSSTVGVIKWGAAGGLASIERGIQITPTGITILFPIRGAEVPSSWTVAWFQKFSGAATFTIDNATSTNVIQLTVFVDGTYEVTRFAGPSVDLFTGSLSRWGDDVWRLIAISAENIGGGQVRYRFAIDSLGVGRWDTLSSTDQTTTYTPPTKAYSAGSFSGDNTTPYSYGQVVVFPEPLDDVWLEFDDGMHGNRGEFAGDRFNRLCEEEGISHAMVGYPTLTADMGPQRPLPLLNLLRECVDADQGTGPYDARGDAALELRTNRSLIAKTPTAVLDYSNKEVAPDFGPTDDDAPTVNDVTAKRPDGGSYRHEQTAGPMNTGDPGTDPAAVGRYDASATVNVEHDGLLVDAAGWRVHMGTIDEPRYPTITVDLAADQVAAQPDLVSALLDLDVDDAVTVTNADAARIFDDVRQLVRGYTETLNTRYQHKLVFNCTPASAYDGATLDSSAARLDNESSFLDPGMDATATTFGVATDSLRNLWTISAGDMPLDIMVSGERMTASAVGAHFFNGAFWQQNFTVTRSVNGVVKSHSFGEAVQLADPVYLVP